MKFYPVDARSEDGRREWLKLRLGRPTASCFHRIITPKRMEISSQAPAYLNELLEEWVTGEEIDTPQTSWMQRGIEDEDAAVAAFEMITDTETTPGGFFTNDAGTIGASPDRLIGSSADLEIKTGAIRTMIGYALDGGITEDHKCQIQGRLLIHEREYVEVFAYNPRIMVPPVKVYRDEKFIKALDAVLNSFVEIMFKKREILEQRFGPFTRPEPEAEPSEFLSESDGERILESLRTSSPA